MPYPARIVNPGEVLVFRNNTTAKKRQEVNNLFENIYRSHNDENTMDQAFIKQLMEIIVNPYNKELRRAILVIPNPNFLQVFVISGTRWGVISPQSRLNVTAKIFAPWTT